MIFHFSSFILDYRGRLNLKIGERKLPAHAEKAQRQSLTGKVRAKDEGMAK
jgi:hypothetical protein